VRPAILDSCIFIHDLRDGRYQAQIDALRGSIENSSVVLAELLRGARKPEEQLFVKRLAENHPVLAPSTNNWIESGEILAKVRTDHGLSTDSLRALHFDVLIALTARSAGARLITSNRADFEIIRSYRDFELELW
jgi:predicted nucleic acid-binding protein